MSGIELDILIEPISPAKPSGDEMVYDPAFEELRNAATGRPALEMEGAPTIAAVEPDWKRAASLALDLLSRTKDLRIAVLLSAALLNLEGLNGLARGTGFTLRLLESFWDSLHPQLDAEDDNDPTARVNALLDLCGRKTFLNPLRDIPLVKSRKSVVVSLRDLEIAEGRLPAPRGADTSTRLELQTIDGAFQDCEIEDLRETAVTVAGALDNLKGIETIITERIGADQAPDLSPIIDLLAEADTLLESQLAKRADGPDKNLETSAGDEVQTNPAPGANQKATNAPQLPAEINSRDDVIRTLDKICVYYARSEPSSPVPLLLQRARRLVKKDFLDIVRDLAPDALAQVETISGSEDDG